MRALLVLLGLAVLVVVVLMWLGMINIDQTRTAQMPSIKVEGGQAPEFQTSVGQVAVGTENKTVEVPTVGTTEKTVAVPTMEVQKAGNAQAPQ